MIYIGIPARNERHTIGPLLWRIRELLLRRSRDFQVVVVDDASTDGTGESLLPYQRVLPLTVLRNETREGYAASLERLVREVVQRSDYLKRDALVTLQADFTNAPEDIPELVRRFEGGADLVVALTRSEGVAPHRVRLATAGARLVGRFMPRPEGIEDTLGSFRLYRLFTLARAIADLPDRDTRLLSHEGWAANAELLLRVLPHVRRSEQIESRLDYTRRYRDSRLRVLSELRGLGGVSRDRRLREIERNAAMPVQEGTR